MEGDKDKIAPQRTEFSDFVVQSAKQYFRNLNLPQEQRERISGKMLLIPFGSVAKGNASEVSSDLDLIFVENDAASYDQPIMPFTDGDYNKDGTSLGEYILNEYAKTHPGIKAERKNHVYPEYIGEMEVDNPHPLVDELIDAIENNTTLEDGKSVRQGGGHSNGVLLGLILNINPELIMAGSPELLEKIRTRIKTHLERKPEAQKLIDEQYNHFIRWKKSEDD